MRRDGRPTASKIKRETFATVIRAYLASPKFGSLAPGTQGQYRYLLAIAERPEILGAVPVDQMRPALTQAYLDGFADRPGQQRMAQTVIKAVERFAIVRDLLPRPISTGTEAPGSDGGHVPWTDEQVMLAEQRARPHLARAITLAANTGQRGSDLVKMRWNDFEEVDGHLGIKVVQLKTDLELWVPFTDELLTAISAWQRRPGFILHKEDGHPFTRHQLSNHWLRERDTKPELAPLKEAGLVMHGLRGTAVVRLRRAGATTPQICDLVGMSPQMVKRYSRYSDQRGNALAAVIKLNRTAAERPRGKTDKNSG